jgi:hypothetical protein
LQEDCYDALESISQKINTNDVDMRSHVLLSMIKVATAVADVPELPVSSSASAASTSSRASAASQLARRLAALVLVVWMATLRS